MKKILIVDDEKDIRTLLEEWFKFKWHGYEVILAKNGEEGLAIFRKSPTDFKLVVTDHRMPRILGEEMIRQIKQLNPIVPIVLMTADVDIIPVAKAAGADEILEKPWKLESLEKIIQKFF